MPACDISQTGGQSITHALDSRIRRLGDKFIWGYHQVEAFYKFKDTRRHTQLWGGSFEDREREDEERGKHLPPFPQANPHLPDS